MDFIKLGDHFVNLDNVFSISHTYGNDELKLIIFDGGTTNPLMVFPDKEELEILKLKTNIDLTELP